MYGVNTLAGDSAVEERLLLLGSVCPAAVAAEQHTGLAPGLDAPVGAAQRGSPQGFAGFAGRCFWGCKSCATGSRLESQILFPALLCLIL